VIAIVLLFGMVILGAGLVLFFGTSLMTSIQEQTQHSVAVDEGVVTHATLEEVSTADSPRELPEELEGIDRRVEDGGTITIEAFNDTHPDTPFSENVTIDMGAIIYDSPDGEVIYEGGALWERRGSGLTIERPPAITFNQSQGDSQVTIRTVELGDGVTAGTARPDRTARRQHMANVTSMIENARDAGYSNLRLNVTSPYADAWEQYFRNEGMTIEETTDDSVSVAMDGAIGSPAPDSLKFESIDGPTVVRQTPPSHFDASVELTNERSTVTTVDVNITIEGNEVWTRTEDIDPDATETISATSVETWATMDNPGGDVTLPDGLHDYTINVVDSSTGETYSSEGEFYKVDSSTVELTDIDHDDPVASAPDDETTVYGTVRNTDTTDRDATVHLEILSGGTTLATESKTIDDIGPNGGTGTVEFDLSGLGHDSTYTYRLTGPSGTILDDTFTVPPGGGATGASVVVTDVNAPATYVPSGSDFELEVDLHSDTPGDDQSNVTLDVLGGPSDTEIDAAAPENSNNTVTMSVDTSSLAVGQVHDYELDVPGANYTETGSFFVTPSSGDAITTDATATVTGTNATVDAMLVNNGSTDETVTVTLDVQEAAGPFSDSFQQTGVTVAAGGGTTNVSFDLSNVGPATYDYSVSPSTGAGDSGSFEITSGGYSGAPVIVTNVSTPTNYVEQGDDFQVDVDLQAPGAPPTESTDVILDVDDAPSDLQNVGSIGPGNTTVSLAVGTGGLDAGELHEYDLEVPGANYTASGSFYVGVSGSAGISSASASATNDTMTISTTLANDGFTNASGPFQFELLDDDGDPLGINATEDDVTLQSGQNSTIDLELNASSLSGTFNWSVSWNGDSAGGQVVTGGDGFSGGGSGVGTSGAGEGTVTVLGTEISAEDQCDENYWVSDDCDMYKLWAPTSAATILDGDISQTHQFQNPSGHTLVDPMNLNTYDTQEETYSWSWEQEAGESVNLTVRSRYWSAGYDYVNQRTVGGQTWYDYQNEDWVDYFGNLDEPSRRVDASAGENPERVQVLTDGDQVPEVSGVLPDQRNAAEILNQGAADRIDPATNTLDLGPNEAVFLFEMTFSETDDDVPDNYTGDMWEYALNNDVNDPDYNDVIAIVEFQGVDLGNVDPQLAVTDGGSGLSITIPPGDAAANGSSAGVGDVDTNSSTSGGSSPSSPSGDTPGGGGGPGVGPIDSDTSTGGGADPSDPETPEPTPGGGDDDVDIDVGAIEIG